MACKVYRIFAIDMAGATFGCEFNLMLDWADPTLDGMHSAHPKLSSHSWA